MKFRHQRGTFKESMETVQEVSSLKDVERILADARSTLFEMRQVGTLTCKKYIFDSRNGWDTYIVCEDGNGIGFSDAELK